MINDTSDCFYWVAVDWLVIEASARSLLIPFRRFIAIRNLVTNAGGFVASELLKNVLDDGEFVFRWSDSIVHLPIAPNPMAKPRRRNNDGLDKGTMKWNGHFSSSHCP